MKKMLLVFAGGGIGAILRYIMTDLVHRVTPPTFPWGTLAVNLVGSYFIGLVWQIVEQTPVSTSTRVFVLTGLLGAFTTFSTFSLETFALIRDGELKLAVMNQVTSVGLGLLLVGLGMLTVRLGGRMLP